MRILWIAMVLALLALAPSARAQVLPSSSKPHQSVWKRMTPTSFKPTNESALTQCNRAANADSHDALTLGKCQVFYGQLEERAGRSVTVPDGIVFDFMNGRRNGRSFVSRGELKELGRIDKAVLYDLGDGVYIYYFVGDPGRSCNNVGVVIQSPEPVVKAVTPPPPPAVPAKKCRMVTKSRLSMPPMTTALPGFIMQNCCPECGTTTFVPGLVLPTGESLSVVEEQHLVCE
jgi:hypothetical protein